MGHGEGWQYLQVGRFLESAGSTAALLDLHLSGGESRERAIRLDELEWAGLLRSCSALEAYCRHYTADLRPERIAEFLLLNPDFPRSVRFAASRVEAALRTLGRMNGRVAGRPERLAGRLHASLDYAQVDEVLSEPHSYLDSIRQYWRSDSQRGPSDLHRIPDRVGVARITSRSAIGQHSCTTRSGT